ncbi:hypothetical protein PAPYR_2828 [Paratrimastix pyriformis]|uniref:Uncharacterized protein n=1 Tax=Paratrimastix pyriformis TaxID=342808 RepID=A0ABQ8UQ66_9EUKA|nr:hypothetical protein PAPYR_2828 [Paratrimastix pyriformis]
MLPNLPPVVSMMNNSWKNIPGTMANRAPVLSSSLPGNVDRRLGCPSPYGTTVKQRNARLLCSTRLPMVSNILSISFWSYSGFA